MMDTTHVISDVFDRKFQIQISFLKLIYHGPGFNINLFMNFIFQNWKNAVAKKSHWLF